MCSNNNKKIKILFDISSSLAQTDPMRVINLNHVAEKNTNLVPTYAQCNGMHFHVVVVIITFLVEFSLGNWNKIK